MLLEFVEIFLDRDEIPLVRAINKRFMCNSVRVSSDLIRIGENLEFKTILEPAEKLFQEDSKHGILSPSMVYIRLFVKKTASSCAICCEDFPLAILQS